MSSLSRSRSSFNLSRSSVRQEKARTEGFKVLDIENSICGTLWYVIVKGSGHNSYIVTLGLSGSYCDCPDTATPCKHLYFVANTLLETAGFSTVLLTPATTLILAKKMKDIAPLHTEGVDLPLLHAKVVEEDKFISEPREAQFHSGVAPREAQPTELGKRSARLAGKRVNIYHDFLKEEN